MRALWSMITPGAMNAVVWPDGVDGVPDDDATALAAEATAAQVSISRCEKILFFSELIFFSVQDARAFLEQHENISAACKTEEFERCLRPALADKVITGEMEWLKRGRFERLFPVEDSAEAHLPLLRGSANAAAVYWHTRLRQLARDDAQRREEL